MSLVHRSHSSTNHRVVQGHRAVLQALLLRLSFALGVLALLPPLLSRSSLCNALQMSCREHTVWRNVVLRFASRFWMTYSQRDAEAA